MSSNQETSDLLIDPEEIFDDREPITPFEEEIKLAVENNAQDSLFINVFLQTQMYAVLSNNINSNRNLALMPYFVAKTKYGEMVALFSSKYRMRLFDDFSKGYEFDWAREFIKELHPRFGIILNPKSYLSFQLGAKHLQEIRQLIF